MSERVKELKSVIRAKAEHLALISVMADLEPLDERLSKIRSLRWQANQISDRRAADRDRIAALRKQAQDEEEFIATRLGHTLIKTFYFVKDFEKHLTKEQKRILGL